MIKLLFVLFLINSFCLLAGETSALDKYYQNVYLGEKRTANYYGPKDVRRVFSEDLGKEIFLDEYFSQNSLNSSIEKSVFDLHQFWFNKILDRSTCPDEELGENFDYIRYLFRLVSMSYLFESLKVNHRISSELGFLQNSCKLSYKEIFSECEPLSDDMKKFKERVYGKFVNEFEKVKYQSMSKKEMEAWLDLFRLSTVANLDPAFSRLHLWCKEKGINCKTIETKDLNVALNSFCENDKKMMSLICSEKDQILGVSYANKAEELVKISNAFNIINRTGTGEDCLRRFVKVNSNKEIFYQQLNQQFPSIYSSLVKENSSYLQGELFLPGALKEFDMKGLSDFLIALKPPKVIVAKVVIPKPKPKIVPTKIIPKKIPEKIIEPTPVVEEVIVPKVKEFDRALFELETNRLGRVYLDMDKFREDYEFTSKMISSLSIPMKKFQTRQALKDMKDYDHFGAKDAPVGVIFIKFLIDTDNHQGLYNVINVLGDKFYIQNDFEGKSIPVFAELKNDASTKHHWQIILIKKNNI